MTTESKCPFHTGKNSETAAEGNGTTNKDWWPNQLRVDLLNQHSERSNPLGEKFNYAEEFKKLDYAALKADLLARGKYLVETYPQSEYQGDALALMAASYNAVGQKALADDARRAA